MPRRRKRSTFGRVFTRKGRPGFYVRLRLHGRETTRWAGPDRKTAHELLARLLRESAREDLLGEKAVALVTFAEAKADFLRHFEARHAASTYRAEKGRVEWIAEHWASKPVREITAGDVEDLLATLKVENGASRATRNRYASALARMFQFAVAKGWARTDPTKSVKRHREDRRPVPYLDPDAIDRLEAAATDATFATLVRLLADTGMRTGEARRLEWRDVDLDRGIVLVRRSKTREPREIPLTATVEAHLRRLHGEAEAHGKAPLWASLRDMSPSAVSARFRRLAKRAGLEGLRAHDLRHGFCSRLAQAGVPLPTIGELAGHKSVATTQRYAGHVPEGATHAAMRRLEMAEKRPDSDPEGDQSGDQDGGDRATA